MTLVGGAGSHTSHPSAGNPPASHRSRSYDLDEFPPNTRYVQQLAIASDTRTTLSDPSGSYLFFDPTTAQIGHD